MKKIVQFLGILVFVGIFTATTLNWALAQQSGNDSQPNQADQPAAGLGSDRLKPAASHAVSTAVDKAVFFSSFS